MTADKLLDRAMQRKRTAAYEALLLERKHFPWRAVEDKVDVWWDEALRHPLLAPCTPAQPPKEIIGEGLTDAPGKSTVTD
jgi:hypothetical protein